MIVDGQTSYQSEKKIQNISEIIVYILSQQKRFFVDVCFKSSMVHFRLMTFGYFATFPSSGARWLNGRVSDSGARGPGFETYRRRVVSLSKTLYSPKVLVNYPGSDGSVPI